MQVVRTHARRVHARTHAVRTHHAVGGGRSIKQRQQARGAPLCAARARYDSRAGRLRWRNHGCGCSSCTDAVSAAAGIACGGGGAERPGCGRQVQDVTAAASQRRVAQRGTRGLHGGPARAPVWLERDKEIRQRDREIRQRDREIRQ
jgi:hypothetical protein